MAEPNEEPIYAPIPQETRLGICLVIWRRGKGRIGKTVRLSLEDMMSELHKIGVRSGTAAIETALTANLKSSWIERTHIVNHAENIHEYKLTTETGRHAAEFAQKLGVELLPVRFVLMDDTPPKNGGPSKVREEYEMTPALPPAPQDRTEQILDDFLTVISLASDAQRLTKRVTELESALEDAEAAAVLPRAVSDAIRNAITILQQYASIEKTALGRLVAETLKASPYGKTTMSAAAVAQVLAQHFPQAP